MSRLVCALVALVLLSCSDDGGSGDVGHDAGRDAGPTDARVAVEVPEAAIDATIDAGLPAGGAAAHADAGFDAGAPSPDAGSVTDAAVEAPPRARTSLVDQKAWVDVEKKDDPWSDRPSDTTCPPEGYGYEVFGDEDSYVVNTAKCAYKTASQPLRTDVRVGEELAFRVWYFDLTGPTGAEAHLALRVGERDLLDELIPIPSKGMLLSRRVIADEPVAAGTPVMLHVHNHGANQYYMLELSTGPEGS